MLKRHERQRDPFGPRNDDVILAASSVHFPGESCPARQRTTEGPPRRRVHRRLVVLERELVFEEVPPRKGGRRGVARVARRPALNRQGHASIHCFTNGSFGSAYDRSPPRPQGGAIASVTVNRRRMRSEAGVC